jgi:ribosomal-protein-alanine N-acetyltransferase
MNTTILSERLLLRPFLPEDEAAVIRLLTNPDFMVYSPSGALTGPSARVRFDELCKSYHQYGFGKFAVLLRDSPVLLGYCGVEQCEIDGALQVELGFRLHSAYRGQGYATEAGRAFLEWYHNGYQKPVIAFTEPSNKPSIRVLEKLGFAELKKSSFMQMPVTVFHRAIPENQADSPD